MHGLIGSFTVVEAFRDRVMAAMAASSRGLPGNLAYVVAADAEDPSVVWVTEIWESAEAHQASLALPQVRDAIAAARPHLIGMGMRVTTVPVTSLER